MLRCQGLPHLFKHFQTGIPVFQVALNNFEMCIRDRPMSRYAASFASVRNHLMRGDSYLLNLCVSTPVETNLTLRQDVYKRQQEAFPPQGNQADSIQVRGVE